MKTPTWIYPRLIISVPPGFNFRGVAQLVARTAGGREVAGSSPVTPTSLRFMKILKLHSRIARDIAGRVKTTILQINDSQNISVGDELKFMGQINQRDLLTWRTIGIARVDKIVEQRLGDFDAADLGDLGVFASRDEMLQKSRDYAGDDVNFESPTKLVHFKFTTLEKEDEDVVNNALNLIEIKLFADGGSRGNPGPSAGGFILMDMNDKIVVKKGFYLGITTNNQAEYQALKLGLEEALRMQVRHVHVFMDSMLVVNQMLGVFKVKNRDLWPIHVEIGEIVRKFSKVSFTQVPRELNKLADKAVNEALDEAAKHQ